MIQKPASGSYMFWFSFELFLVLCGAGCLGYFVRELYDFKTIDSWSQTQGVIIDSKIAEDRSRRSRKPLYKPQVRYSYVVAGQLLEGSNLVLGGGLDAMKYDEADLIATHYATGTKVTVYYHPRYPERAVLIRNQLGGDMLLSLVIGGMLILINSLLIYAHSPWLQYQLSHIPLEAPQKQPPPARRNFSRRERKQQQKKD